MKKNKGLIILGLIVLNIVIYAVGDFDRETPDYRQMGIDACVDRGIAYFQEIGSYPTLSAYPNEGRRAEEVARERCRRNNRAF